MQRVSVNGILRPTVHRAITDEYRGHFLKVSYIQEIEQKPIYSKDRINVEDDGRFRCFIPSTELLGNDNLVTIEVYAPDGELLGKQIYSYESLKAAAISESAADTTEPLSIEVDPKIIVFNASSPVTQAYRKIKGKVIDLTGQKQASGLQLIIMVSDDPNTGFDSASYRPIFSTVTDHAGYFFGQVENSTHQQAYGVIAGLESHPVAIPLEAHKLPKDIILVLDLSDLSDEVTDHTPNLPDSDDLVNSTAFSQDIGGKCVDFTVPNRTLEEFSFYHTVRTTEPEIRGLTITTKESKKLKAELFAISDNMFTLFGKLNTSFNTLSIIPYTAEEANVATKQPGLTTASRSNEVSAPIYTPPSYVLKVPVLNQTVKLTTQDILAVDQSLSFSLLIKILAEQEQRKKKLLALHHKLAAAYCGKYGVQEAQSYCETLTAEDNLDREQFHSLHENIQNYVGFVEPNREVSRQFTTFATELGELIQQPFVARQTLGLLEQKGNTLIQAIDAALPASQQKQGVLSYLDRVVVELAQAKAQQVLDFEPCPPAEETETMGILCIIQEFDKTKTMLRHKSLFSLGEILTIRSHYDIFLTSITTFLTLLEEFHTFYASSKNFMISLEDDYFIEHSHSIKSTLIALKQQIYIAINKIEDIEHAYISNHPGRQELTVENSIDWDETPTIYENTTIAHGHILHFKQKWKADGYSLGDLLYSLPLAPCQEKQIAILDWDRREQGRGYEASVASEALQAELSRDRDISDINRLALSEAIEASSTNTTKSTSGGAGGGIGFLLGPIGFGIGGGVSHSGASSRSTAQQNSARNLSSSALNRLRDRISQSATAVRNQRSTVIQTVAQNETVNVQTEVIKNNNHCHAMTVEYFEVLKHYAIEQELVAVQECLFVPLPMSHFDHQKVRRWRNTLRQALYGDKLSRGFDAIERIETDYAHSDLPVGSYADETIEVFSGHFTISFELKRPYISKIEEETKTEEYDLALDFPWFSGKLIFHLEREVPLTEAEKDAIFEEQYAADIVRSFIDTLEITGIADEGTEERLELDFTLLSNYHKGLPLRVNIASKAKQEITRRQIKHLRFRANTSVKSSSKIILRSAYLHYRTQHLSEYIVRSSRLNNDIINTTEVKIDLSSAPWFEIVTKTDAALIYAPLSAKELADPRKTDREAAALLLNFLNEHLEMAHKVIWSSLDSSRLFGLLDGYIAPHSGGKSVASVVENKIMGIVGNNLVLKVIPGERLDPVFKGVEDLFAYYQPTTPPDPFRISVPTKGVYAESVMGQCNSCETIDDTRHWRFEEAPCGTKPTAINPISTESRRSEPGDLQAKDFPSNIINMQTAPEAPAPTGLAAAYSLLGKSDVFKDMTGLAGTQANAIKALETTSKSVTDLAGLAADIQKQQAMKKDIGKALKTIQQAESDKQISKDQANELSYKALSSMVGEPTKKTENLTQQPEVKALINSEAQKKQSNIKLNRGDESVEISTAKTGTSGMSFDYSVPGTVPIVAQPSNMTCWATVATMLLSWHDEKSYTIEAAMDKADAKYRTMFDNNQGLPAAEHEAFAAACGMTGEPPMNYTVSGLRALLETHGPLIAVADEAPGGMWAIHARVIWGIYGDGSVDGTFLRINDPAGGHQYSESFRAFAHKYEQVADAPRLQIMHY